MVLKLISYGSVRAANLVQVMLLQCFDSGTEVPALTHPGILPNSSGFLLLLSRAAPSFPYSGTKTWSSFLDDVVSLNQHCIYKATVSFLRKEQSAFQGNQDSFKNNHRGFVTLATVAL